MEPPHHTGVERHQCDRGRLLRGVALVAAFAGAGITAIAVLAIVVGPASVLLERAFSARGAGSGGSAGQPYPG